MTGVTLITEDDTSAGASWSIVYARSFVIPVSTTPAGEVDYAEYVIRNNSSTVITPLGSGVEITDLGTLTKSNRDLAFNIPANTLAKGDIHSLAIRFRNSLGNWSMTETRHFMLAPEAEIDGTVVRGNTRSPT